jgi:hypothetical protein
VHLRAHLLQLGTDGGLAVEPVDAWQGRSEGREGWWTRGDENVRDVWRCGERGHST